MTAVWTSLAATIGTVVTTLIGVLAGAAVSKRSQDLGWTRDQLTKACVRTVEECSRIIVDLSDMDRARPPTTPPGAVLPTTIDWRPWNQALNMINLTAGADIAEAAHVLDEQVWRMHRVTRRGLRPGEDWMALRHAIEEAQREFINTARRHLARDPTPLRRLTGKPAPDDAIWE